MRGLGSDGCKMKFTVHSAYHFARIIHSGCTNCAVPESEHSMPILSLSSLAPRSSLLAQDNVVQQAERHRSHVLD